MALRAKKVSSVLSPIYSLLLFAAVSLHVILHKFAHFLEKRHWAIFRLSAVALKF